MNQPSPHVWSGWICDDDLNNVWHDPMSTNSAQYQIPVNEQNITLSAPLVLIKILF